MLPVFEGVDGLEELQLLASDLAGRHNVDVLVVHRGSQGILVLNLKKRFLTVSLRN